MKNILKPGYESVAIGALLAALLPGCVFNGTLNCESCGPQEASGADVLNCGFEWTPTELHGRHWTVWAARDTELEPVWVPGNPMEIAPLPSGSACGSEPGSMSSISFASLGAVEGDIVRVRAIRINVPFHPQENYQIQCTQWQLGGSQCDRWCSAYTDPSSCSTAALDGNPVADAIDFKFKYKSTASQASVQVAK